VTSSLPRPNSLSFSISLSHSLSFSIFLSPKLSSTIAITFSSSHVPANPSHQSKSSCDSPTYEICGFTQELNKICCLSGA
jgi:hypothetical protein